ncbi:MAG: LytTR family DNA-binding domain-containing protein [Bacteroidota bacterium]|jgi:two-component system LytT family response regulator
MKPSFINPTLTLDTRQNKRVDIDQILFLESDINYTHFYFKSQRRTIMAHSLKHFEADLLPRGFLRIHRSYIVNSRFIQSVNLFENTLTLTDGTVLKVARRRVKEIAGFCF